MRKLIMAAVAAAGLSLATSQANATVFTLDSIDVIAHTGDSNGLSVTIQKLFTASSQHDYDLGETDPYDGINLFNIYTTESSVNYGEDTVPQDIEVKFHFSAPSPNVVDPVLGDTSGWVNGFSFFGTFIPTGGTGGKLVWDNGGVFQMHYGANLTGLMTISLNGGDFNDGWFRPDQGCVLFHGCDAARSGLTVQATLDWDHDPVPEPTTWALMIGGLGAAGGALRRRRTALA